MTAGGAFAAIDGASAACGDAPGGGNGIVYANAGSVCLASFGAYTGANVGYVTGAGSSLTFTQASAAVLSTGGGGAYALAIGGANIGGTPIVPGATVQAQGSLAVTANATSNSRALLIYGGATGDPTNRLLVDGDLVVHRTSAANATGGAAIQMSGPAGYIRVNGTTLADSPNTDIFRNSGSGDFYGNVTLRTTATGGGAGTGLLASGGALTFHQDLTVATRAGDAINLTGGSVVVTGVGTVTSQGGRGVVAAGATTQASFGTLDVATFGNLAPALQVSSGGSVSIGAGSVTTSGSQADAIYLIGSGSIAIGGAATSTANAEVRLAAGSITTSGAGANGLRVEASAGDAIVRQGGSSAIRAAGNGIQASSTSGAVDIEANNVVGGQAGVLATGGATTRSLTVAAASGSVTGGADAGIVTDAQAGTPVAVTVRSGAVVSATSGIAIRDTGGNATVTLESGSRIVGAVRLGNGNDALTVIGAADIGGAGAILDGGNATDPSVTDVLGSAGAATNTLTFRDTAQTLTGANLRNWQTVALSNSSVILADGTLLTSTGVNPDASRRGLLLANGSTLSSPVALSVNGDVGIDATSTLRHALGGTITGNVANAGLIDWLNLGQTLTIAGNYAGIAGSRISLETRLFDDASATDRMVVTGSTSGATTIQLRPASGSVGAQTTVGIDLVQVGGVSAGVFSLTGPVQAGAYQYVLKKGGNGGNAGDWYLVSNIASPPVEPPQTVTPTPPSAASPPPSANVPIYRPGTGAYVSGQALNADEGFFTVGTFHERRGENTRADAEGRQSWIRPYWKGFAVDGKSRFSLSDAKLWGLQAGQDLVSTTTAEGTSVRAAVTLDYARGMAELGDRVRPQANLAARIGTMQADSFGIGLTYSHVDRTGAYLDLVGRVSFLRNRFSVADTGVANQDGTRGTLSIEVGKPFVVGSGWEVEPQAQAIYMHTRYDGFVDSISAVGGYAADALRGRIGVRLSNTRLLPEDGALRVYGIADILHDFLPPAKVRVGGTPVSDDFRHAGFDLGVGAEYRLDAGTAVFGRGLYMASFNSGKAEGYLFSAGLKHQF